MEAMRANPKVREWWAMTDGMQVGCTILDHTTTLETNALAIRRALSPVPWVVPKDPAGGRRWMKSSIPSDPTCGVGDRLTCT